MAKKDNTRIVKPLFDKKADITTGNNGQYHIRKARVYVCGSGYYGKLYTISSNKYNKNNVHVIKEVYPYDNKRLRFLIVNFKNAKKFKTIEKLPDGRERKIAVIEKYDDVTEYICSIGDIKKFKSDILDLDKKKKVISRDNIKRLILRPEKEKSKDKDKKKAA